MKNLINSPELDAKYVKKSKLKEYLPQSILKLEPKEPKTNRVSFFSFSKWHKYQESF